MRLCLMCKHFDFHPGDHGFSECTPGCAASITCMKGHWDLDMFDDNLTAFRDKMKQAETCQDFKEVTP